MIFYLFILLRFRPGLSFLMSDHSVASFLHEGGKCVPVYSFALFNNFQYVNNVILLEILDGLGIEGTIVLLNNKSLHPKCPLCKWGLLFICKTGLSTKLKFPLIEGGEAVFISSLFALISTISLL